MYLFVLDQYWASEGKKCVDFTSDLKKKVVKAQYRFLTAVTAANEPYQTSIGPVTSCLLSSWLKN